ncbi:unnamed protein product [Acanthosepion pharaonis]|uniref:Uncharacterized protein n=1 Tax=Acanthosepion pharaonis TaxID=158019 RepID=A0A812DRC5_ACAPH|nr:unnamed protein product [Sepia pharaonis]
MGFFCACANIRAHACVRHSQNAWGLRVTDDIYQDVLKSVEGLDGLERRRTSLCLPAGPLPTQKAKTTQAWLLNNVPHHWSPDLWSPFSPDCNPLASFFCGVIEAKTNKHAHNTVDSLRAKETPILQTNIQISIYLSIYLSVMGSTPFSYK